MAISNRVVKNKRDKDGKLTGRPGTVYDINVKYRTVNGYKAFVKRGFATRAQAATYEAEIKAKFAKKPSVMAALSENGKQTIQKYLMDWIERYGKVNLRPNTIDGYKSNIQNHLIPHIGNYQLRELSPEIIDTMLSQLFDEGLSNSSVRYCFRILSVALESARKYHYIENNPARDILTRFGKQGETPDPYTIPQLQRLIAGIAGDEYEMPIMLAGLYGLRISETIGLRWKNVDLAAGTFNVKEQLPELAPGSKVIPEKLPPVKTHSRILPITDLAKPYFERAIQLQKRQKELCQLSDIPYHENGLVMAHVDGSPYRRDGVDVKFAQILRKLHLPHIRFHDLRHTAATNMHELSGDFYTVSQILGHSLKGMGIELGLACNFDSVTSRYVDVRIERKKMVLDNYHKAVFHKSSHPEPER